MKKGKYWFSKLSHKQKGQFRKAKKAVEYSFTTKEVMERDYINFLDFLSKSFGWWMSEQGFEYWYKIASKNVK